MGTKQGTVRVNVVNESSRWRILQMSEALPSAQMLEDFEDQGWEIVQMIDRRPKDVFVYLRRNLLVVDRIPDRIPSA